MVKISNVNPTKHREVAGGIVMTVHTAWEQQVQDDCVVIIILSPDDIIEVFKGYLVLITGSWLWFISAVLTFISVLVSAQSKNVFVFTCSRDLTVDFRFFFFFFM